MIWLPDSDCRTDPEKTPILTRDSDSCDSRVSVVRDGGEKLNGIFVNVLRSGHMDLQIAFTQGILQDRGPAELHEAMTEGAGKIGEKFVEIKIGG